MLAGCTKGLQKIKSIKAKCQEVLQVCTTKCYNKNNKFTVYGIVQYSTLQLWQIYER